ncbi:MAG: hypothetical protein U5L72_16450 [Bacteroidales bacterium]|nr:hypothetical protein [Bacteroidales bacterium]
MTPPCIITVELQQLMFVPVKRIIEPVAKDVDSVVYYSLTIDKFFDPLDATYLQHLLDQEDRCLRLSVRFCLSGDSSYLFSGRRIAREDLVAAIESKSLTFTATTMKFM